MGPPAHATPTGHLGIVWNKGAPPKVYSESGDVGTETRIHVHFQEAGVYYPPSVELHAHEVAGHAGQAFDWGDTVFNNEAYPNVCPYCTQGGSRVHSRFWMTSNLHNGDWVISGVVHYTQYPGGNQSYTLPTIHVNLRNGIITAMQPLNPDPILWDPDAEPHTYHLSATTDQAYDSTTTELTLEIFKSDQTLIRTVHLDRPLPAGTNTIETDWDGTCDPPNPSPAPKGVYLFRWKYGRQFGEIDTDCDKSAQLSITQTKSDLTDEYNEETDQNTTVDGCVLTDSGDPRADALEADVRVYGWNPSEEGGEGLLSMESGIELIAGPYSLGTTTNPPGAQNPVWVEAMFPLIIHEEEVHLFSAVDNHVAQDKTHRARPALQKGKPAARKRADCFTYKFGAPPGTTARGILKRMGYVAAAWDQQPTQKILDRLQSDSVLFYAGDGALDVTQDSNYYGGVSGTSNSVLLGLKSTTIPSKQGGTGITFKFITDMPQHKLSGKTKLAVWLACVTGVNGLYLDPTRDYQTGNLIDETTGWGGATCALGFMTTITANQTIYNSWSSAFFSTLSSGGTVHAAALAGLNAADGTYSQFRTIPSNGNVTLP